MNGNYKLQLEQYWETKKEKDKEEKKAYYREYAQKARQKAREERREEGEVLSGSDLEKIKQERKETREREAELKRAEKWERERRQALPLFLVEMSGDSQRIKALDSVEAIKIYCDSRAFNYKKLGYLVRVERIFEVEIKTDIPYPPLKVA